jgi:hypothetical protein
VDRGEQWPKVTVGGAGLAGQALGFWAFGFGDAYREALAAIFFTMAKTSLRSLSLRLVE